MLVIPQPDRILVRQQVRKYSRYIKGVVLDVGPGRPARYADLFTFDKYITLDIDKDKSPDIVADVQNIPLKDESVDSIVVTGVLGDVENPPRAMEEFYRVLKRGGAILITENLLSHIHDEPNDFWRFTNFAFEKLFKKAGFEVIAIDQRGGFFSALAQLRIRYLIDRFNLYSRWWMHFLVPFISLYCKLNFFLDKLDKSKANRNYTLGWCAVAKKI